MKANWNHPLPFGDSLWVRKKDVEPLVKSVRKLLDNIYEFDKPTDSILLESVETSLSRLLGDEAVEHGVQRTALWHCSNCGSSNSHDNANCYLCGKSGRR